MHENSKQVIFVVQSDLIFKKYQRALTVKQAAEEHFDSLPGSHDEEQLSFEKVYDWKLTWSWKYFNFLMIVILWHFFFIFFSWSHI